MCDFLKEIALEGGTARLGVKGKMAPDAPPQPPDFQDLINDMQSGDQPEPDQAQQGGSPPGQEQRGGNLPDQAQQGGIPPDHPQRVGTPPDQPPAGGSPAAGRTDEGKSGGNADTGAGKGSPPE